MPDIKQTANQFERENPRQVEDSIQSSNFGGLNTAATPINCPYTDSPYLLNTSVDVNGDVNKRQGTKQLLSTIGAVQSATMMPFTTGLGYNLVVVKNGLNLEVYEIINDVCTRIMLKSNVWTSAANLVRPAYVRTSEVEPRLLMMTGVNKPVQLKFAEQSSTVTVGSLTTTTTFSDLPGRYANATTSNMVVYVDRVRQLSATFSYAGTTLTVNNISIPTGTHVVDVMLVTWAWWAEGTFYQGNRYYQVTNRNNASTADLSVPIPLYIRTDINPLKYPNNNFNIVPYDQTALPNGWTNPNNNAPTLATEYGFSDGGTYKAGGGTNLKLNPSSLYITFGALTGGGASAPLYWIRRRELRLNNGQPIIPTQLDVYVDGTKQNQIYSGGPGATVQDYYLYTDDGFGSAVVSLNNTTPASYMAFEFSAPIGVNYASFVAVTNNAATHIGSAAVTTRQYYLDGGYVPAYGLGFFADYKNGYYPRQVALFQGRLVLSGFPQTPLVVVLSTVADTTIPGQFYNFFQVNGDLQGVPSDPFDLVVSSSPDDYVVAFQEWQGNLFCFTRKGVFRIYGVNQPLSATSNAINLVSNMGLVNEQCIAATETSLMYLSDFGVFDLVPYTLYGEYQVRERSLKIRNNFGITLNPNYASLPWMRYDAARRIVYLGYPVAGEFYTNRRLFIFSTFRESWTEFDTTGGFQSFSASSYTDRSLGQFFGMLVSKYRIAGVPNDITFIRFNDSRYVDFRQALVGTGSNITPFVKQPSAVTYTTAAGQRAYSTDFTLSGSQTSAFRLIPLSTVQDIKVTLNGAVLAFGIDYQKLPNGYIYLQVDPGVGKTLVISERRFVMDSDEGRAYYGVSSSIDVDTLIVFLDNVQQTPGAYSVTASAGGYIATIATLNGQFVEVGNAYVVAYSTPMFNSQSLAANKRLTHIMAYMVNDVNQVWYSQANVNAVDGQPASQILDYPIVRMNANFLIEYSSTDDSQNTYDIYGYPSLVWDDGLFDIPSSSRAFQQFQLFKQPIIGTGYAIQFFILSYDDSYFSLAGYQLIVATKGRRVMTRY